MRPWVQHWKRIWTLPNGLSCALNLASFQSESWPLVATSSSDGIATSRSWNAATPFWKVAVPSRCCLLVLNTRTGWPICFGKEICWHQILSSVDGLGQRINLHLNATSNFVSTYFFPKAVGLPCTNSPSWQALQNTWWPWVCSWTLWGPLLRRCIPPPRRTFVGTSVTASPAPRASSESAGRGMREKGGGRSLNKLVKMMC